MKQNNTIIASIDIGTTKIAVTIGRKNENGSITILSTGSAASTGLKRGVVLKVEQTVEAIKKAVKIAEAKAQVKITHAYVGIAGYNIRCTHNTGYINRENHEEPISKADITKLKNDIKKLPLPVGEEILHVIPQTYIVDNENIDKDPRGMYGKRLDGNFHVVISDIAASNKIRKCVELAGIKVRALVLEPIASSDAVLSEDEKEMGVVLIDIGGGTTDVAVFHEGIIRHTSVIPFGGNIITEDLKEGCSLLQRQAETLKRKYGSAVLSKEHENTSIDIVTNNKPNSIELTTAIKIIRARMEEILEQVAFQVESSGISNKIMAGFVITGGGALLKNICQLASFKLGLDGRIGYPTQRIDKESIEGLIKTPQFSTSVGLMKLGIEQNKNCCITFEELHQLEQKAKETEEVKEETKSEKSFLKKISNKFPGLFNIPDEDM